VFLDANRLEAGTRTVRDEQQRTRGAIERIRSQPMLHNVPIVFIPENAPGMAGGHLWEHINDMQPITVMAECGPAKGPADNLRVGVPKNETVTEEMRYRFIDLLATGSVRFSERYVSLPRDGSDGSQAARDKFISQLTTYRPGIKKKYGENYNDDLLIAVMMGLPWRERFYRSPVYQDFIAKYMRQY
jgi:hypothetical protein